MLQTHGTDRFLFILFQIQCFFSSSFHASIALPVLQSVLVVSMCLLKSPSRIQGHFDDIIMHFSCENKAFSFFSTRNKWLFKPNQIPLILQIKSSFNATLKIPCHYWLQRKMAYFRGCPRIGIRKWSCSPLPLVIWHIAQ